MAEYLWDNGPILYSAPGVFPMGTDSILLADFAGAGKRDKILDLGTGSGLLPVLLLSKFPETRADALELSEPACRLAERNFAENGLRDRCRLIHGDLRAHRALLSAGEYDLVVSNPPYFAESSGFVAEKGLGTARSDGSCTLQELCAAAGYALKWGGKFCVVFRPERLCTLIFCLQKYGMEPKRLLPVHHREGQPVNLILLEARRGGKPGLTWENDLYLYTPAGQESPRLRAIYHRA